MEYISYRLAWYKQTVERNKNMSELTNEQYVASLELYEKLVATNVDVDRKGKDGKVSIRLSKGERETFLSKNKTELSVQYGSVMKEYVVVPDYLLKNTSELKTYFDISYAYIGTLKSKPTKKK